MKEGKIINIISFIVIALVYSYFQGWLGYIIPSLLSEEQHQKLGNKLFDQKDFIGAKKHFEKSQKSSYVLSRIIQVEYELGNYDTAIDCYKSFFGSPPVSAKSSSKDSDDLDEAYYALGKVYLSRSGYGTAIECFKEALEYKYPIQSAHNKRPGDLDGKIYFELGNCYFYQDQFNSAITCFDKSIDSKYSELGNVYFQKQLCYMGICNDFKNIISDIEKKLTNITDDESDEYFILNMQYESAVEEFELNKSLVNQNLILAAKNQNKIAEKFCRNMGISF